MGTYERLHDDIQQAPFDDHTRKLLDIILRRYNAPRVLAVIANDLMNYTILTDRFPQEEFKQIVSSKVAEGIFPQLPMEWYLDLAHYLILAMIAHTEPLFFSEIEQLLKHSEHYKHTKPQPGSPIPYLQPEHWTPILDWHKTISGYIYIGPDEYRTQVNLGDFAGTDYDDHLEIFLNILVSLEVVATDEYRYTDLGGWDKLIKYTLKGRVRATQLSPLDKKLLETVAQWMPGSHLLTVIMDYHWNYPGYLEKVLELRLENKHYLLAPSRILDQVNQAINDNHLPVVPLSWYHDLAVAVIRILETSDTPLTLNQIHNTCIDIRLYRDPKDLRKSELLEYFNKEHWVAVNIPDTKNYIRRRYRGPHKVASRLNMRPGYFREFMLETFMTLMLQANLVQRPEPDQYLSLHSTPLVTSFV